ncbi:hypothetical protein [Micromonospora sp. NPDC003816]|uniref:hypothetical protein n=1 Tax=Micromonospora sp. NPDC003816 TaxID=3364224 RepID=UPI003697A121
MSIMPRLSQVLVAIVLAAGGVVLPDSAAAVPTPQPSSSQEWCPTPSVERPAAGEEVYPQVNWCLPWVRWQDGTGWLTECSTAVSAVDQEHCDAVSLTVQSPPPDGVLSVLDDRLPPAGGRPVRCERFADRAGEDPANAGRWSAKQSRCEVLREVIAASSSLRASACSTFDVACQVAEQARDVARTGFEGLADIAVAGFAWALGKLATLVFEETSVVADEPFYGVYNDVSGVLIIVVLLFFVFSTAINGLRLNGPGPLSSLGGLVRAMFGIAFAGGIAFLLMAAWDEATVALIRRNEERDWQPSMWVEALNVLTGDTGTVLFAFSWTGKAAQARLSVEASGLVDLLSCLEPRPHRSTAPQASNLTCKIRLEKAQWLINRYERCWASECRSVRLRPFA